MSVRGAERRGLGLGGGGGGGAESLEVDESDVRRLAWEVFY